ENGGKGTPEHDPHILNALEHIRIIAAMRRLLAGGAAAQLLGLRYQRDRGRRLGQTVGVERADANARDRRPGAALDERAVDARARRRQDGDGERLAGFGDRFDYESVDRLVHDPRRRWRFGADGRDARLRRKRLADLASEDGARSER